MTATGAVLMMFAGQVERAVARGRTDRRGGASGPAMIMRCASRCRHWRWRRWPAGSPSGRCRSPIVPSSWPNATTPPGPTILVCGTERPSPTPTASTRPRWCCTPAGAERSRPATSPACRSTTGRSPSCAWAAATGTTPLAEAQAGLGFVGDTEFHVGDVFAHAICAHVASTEASWAQPRQRSTRPAAGSWPARRDRLRVDELDRRAAARGAGPAGTGPGDAGRDVGSDRAGPLPAGHGAGHGHPTSCAWPWPPETASVPVRSPRSSSAAPHGPAPRPPRVSRCAVAASSTTTSDALLAAVAAHRGGPRPYLLAAACEDAGVALGRGRARSSEAVVAARARRRPSTSGSTPAGTSTGSRRRWRALGVTTGPPGLVARRSDGRA